MRTDAQELYEGREQTYLKHRALEEYPFQWGIKVGSVSKKWRGRLKLWYCDLFAGPWKSRDASHTDNSVWLGLSALLRAQERSAQVGAPFEVGAVLVEKNQHAFKELREVCKAFSGRVDVQLLCGEFEEKIAEVNRLVGSMPACAFVDPTGWSGAGMESVARVASGWRDILVRVPAETHRFASKPAVRDGLIRFFGIDPAVAASSDGEQLIALYCAQLKVRGGVGLAAEMVLPEPKRARAAGWLVVGGGHPQVLEVFRDVEQRVIGGEALNIRDEILHERNHPGQMRLFAPSDLAQFDRLYRERLERSVRAIPADVIRELSTRGSVPYGELWPALLERHHVTKRDLGEIILDLVPVQVQVKGVRSRERTLKDEHLLQLARPSRG